MVLPNDRREHDRDLAGHAADDAQPRARLDLVAADPPHAVWRRVPDVRPPRRGRRRCADLRGLVLRARGLDLCRGRAHALASGGALMFRRILTMIAKDLRTSTRDQLALYILLSPFLLGLMMRLVMPIFEDARPTFVVTEALAQTERDALAAHGELEV